MYMLIGILCGLAIYNGTIIDLCFPLALYKKLLQGKQLVTKDICFYNIHLAYGLDFFISIAQIHM